MLHFEPEEFDQRMARTREAMARRGLDVLLRLHPKANIG